MATTKVSPTPPTGDISRVFDKAVCLSLYLGKIGNRKRVPTSAIEVKADKKMIAVSKALLDSKQLQEINRLDIEIRAYVCSRAIPANMFRSGIYPLPLALLAEVDDTLREFQQKREALVEKFIEVYPALIDAASGKLEGLFNAADYPPASLVRSLFNMSWQYVTFGTPGSLQKVDADIYEREKGKITRQMQDAVNEIIYTMRSAFAQLVSHMAERLADPKKVFRDSLVQNLREFMASFDFRNISDDKELASQVKKMRQLLSGLDPQDLRDDAALRKSMAAEVTKMKAELDTMIADRPTRAITFED